MSEPFRPQVCLLFPHNHAVSPGAAIAYARAQFTSRDVDVVASPHVGTSFVPQGYNIGLSHALAMRDLGLCTHFAMLHADIEPEDRWLDKLWAEMRKSGADAIAAVAPIKEPQYQRTTTVIGNPDDPWEPKRFVTMSDRANLPDTFTIKDCGDPATEFLQINTGCMLVDLRNPWWDIPRAGATGDFFAFELMQEIVRVPMDPHDYGAMVNDWRGQLIEARKAGDEDAVARMIDHPPLGFRRITRSRSEDWEMSRHIWEHGGTCAATFAVAINHHGDFAWSNQARVLVKGD
jgi:hypothetical protein